MRLAPPRAVMALAALFAAVFAVLSVWGSTTTESATTPTPAAISITPQGLSSTRPALHPPPKREDVALGIGSPGPAVPARFIGLSMEASALVHWGEFGHEGDLAALLRSLGPGLIRFGGISADTDAAWVDAAHPKPAWAGWTVTAADLEGVADFARSSGWQVVLTVGLAHYDPGAAAAEVAVAHAALGGYLDAIEIGNEPDSYATHGLRGPGWGPKEYLAEVAAYRAAIAKLTPGVSIVGPDVSGSHVFGTWATAIAASDHPLLLTGHHYPLGCHEAITPTIGLLLSDGVRHAEGAALDRFQSIADAAHVPFRLDETGSVSCGGMPGVSNTFASALWALDISVRAMTTGISGMNFEGNVEHCDTYTPLCAATPAELNTGALTAQPEWYALLLEHFVVGERPIAVHVSPAAANVDVVALTAPNGAVHVVVIDDAPAGSAAVAMHLQVGDHFNVGRVLTLSAPTADSLTGVTLGGTTVSSNGTWSAPPTTPVVDAVGGDITVTVSPTSAALVTLSNNP